MPKSLTVEISIDRKIFSPFGVVQNTLKDPIMENSDWISPNYSVIPPTADEDDAADRNITTVTTSATNCSMPYPLARDYNVVTATICGLYFMFGVMCTFFGYRCFKVRRLRDRVFVEQLRNFIHSQEACADADDPQCT